MAGLDLDQLGTRYAFGELPGQISVLLGAGLSTEVIRTLLPCASGDRPEMRQCPRVVDTVGRELAVMDKRIESREQSRDVLASYRLTT